MISTRPLVSALIASAISRADVHGVRGWQVVGVLVGELRLLRAHNERRCHETAESRRADGEQATTRYEHVSLLVEGPQVARVLNLAQVCTALALLQA